MLKKKWKYLRDQYAFELTKVKRPKSGAASDEVYLSKWPHFKVLSFLKEIVKPRQTSGNCTVKLESVATEDMNSQHPNLEENEETVAVANGSDDGADELISMNDNESNIFADATHATIIPEGQQEVSIQNQPNVKKHTVNRIKRKRSNDYQSTMLEIEKKKLEILSSKRTDKKDDGDEENLLFFKTLLPHVKKIRPEQIFPFRSKIQDVVQAFAYPASYYIQSPTALSTASTSGQSTYDDYTHNDDENEEIAGLATYLNIK